MPNRGRIVSMFVMETIAHVHVIDWFYTRYWLQTTNTGLNILKNVIDGAGNIIDLVSNDQLCAIHWHMANRAAAFYPARDTWRQVLENMVVVSSGLWPSYENGTEEEWRSMHSLTHWGREKLDDMLQATFVTNFVHDLCTICSQWSC